MMRNERRGKEGGNDGEWDSRRKDKSGGFDVRCDLLEDAYFSLSVQLLRSINLHFERGQREEV